MDISFQRLDWMIAWRHLRAGDTLPAWVIPVMLTAIYLILVGVTMIGYAVVLDPVNMCGDEAGGQTALQGYFSGFGALTLAAGVMALLFALLACFFNLLPTIIAMSVLLGCMALVVVLSLMSGLEGDMRDKILNQKAHVRVARADGRPFADYLGLSSELAAAPGVVGASPYLEGEIMVRSRLNRQGAILSGIVPDLHATASNLPGLVREGSYEYLESPESIPDPDPFALEPESTPWRLRHLEKKEPKPAATKPKGVDAEASAPKPGEVSAGMAGVGLQGIDGKADAGRDAASKLPSPPHFDLPKPPPREADDGWEDPAVELGRAPAPEADKPAAEADDEGWEDPAEELGQRKPGPPELQLPPRQDAGNTDEEWLSVDGDGVVEDPVLVGRELASELGISTGSEVQLITPVGRMTPAGRMPGSLLAQVGGVFFSGMYEYDRKNIYAPLPVVQRFLLAGDRVSGIEIKLADVDAIDEGKAAALAVVHAAGRDDELIVEDWRDLNRNLFSAMFLEKVAMFIALLFVVLVASFGILASNLMSVMEKSKEIAILKAMGTSDRGILRVFIAEGLCVGILGSLGGIGTGLGLCWWLDFCGLPLNENVYYVEKLPVVVDPSEVALVGVAALVIVCLSSLYPALVASRLRPVDALRQAEQ
ncbi:MAG: FtsX-like permease family protein [Deltaproteobacteria bacterium]|nr:FtsX-like permease family protein [Nannocystaceae bacterium]